MKKCMVLLILTAVILCCGCQTQYEYEFEQPADQVRQVYIVLEENGTEQRIECTTDILADIQALPCRKYWNDPPFMIVVPYVLIEYNNGAVEKICAHSNCYEIDGEIDFDWEYFDTDEFSEVLQKYR